MDILLKNGFIVSDKIEKSNLYIKNRKIEAITNDLPSDVTVIDCTGKYIVPGLIDMHVHLREPGEEYKEDIISGAEAACAGGVTTMCAMANTKPVIDNSALVSYIVNKGKETGLVDIMPYGCVTRGMEGTELTDMGDMLSKGAAGFSDDGRPVENAEVMRRALEYSKYFSSFIACHEEDCALFNHGSVSEGLMSAVTGMRGAPAEAESVMVARDIELARLTGGRVHICHVSSRHSVEFIRRGKEAGINVTAEVTPNHLTLTEDICASYDTSTKINPPLREEQDRLALLAALKSGVIDCLATDHAPHHIDDKYKEYDLASYGMLGLQFTIPLMLGLIAKGELTWLDFVQATGAKPAAILGLKDRGRLARGLNADIAVIDPNDVYIYDAKVNKSKSTNTPYWGEQIKGRAVVTVKNGIIVHNIIN